MHKCSRCGQEFEGNFCPECGTPSQEVKACPVCGVRVLGNVKFCPECGYPYTKAKPYTQLQANENSRAKKAGTWIKSHLKILIPVILGLIVLIVMLSLIPTFIAIPSSGTYYECYDGEYQNDSYITLKNYKWSDGEGSSGKYKLSGSKIKVYVSIAGKTDVYNGTVKNGILKIDTDGDGEIDATYYRKNHKHVYGSWQTYEEATCITAETQIRICSCGHKDSRKTTFGPHIGTKWISDNGYHWEICTACGYEFEKSECGKEDKCSVCGYYRFEYKLNNDNSGYSVSEVFSINYENVIIPAHYNDLPVIEIDGGAFHHCRNIISVIIPDSVTYIGGGAFRGCDSLTSVIIPNSVTFIVGSAFEDCSSLTSITLPESVTAINSDTFRNCTSLTSVNIGNNIDTIGNQAFYGCHKLTDINFEGTIEQWNSINKYGDWNYNTGDYTVQCTDGKLDKNGNEIVE